MMDRYISDANGIVLIYIVHQSTSSNKYQQFRVKYRGESWLSIVRELAACVDVSNNSWKIKIS